MIQHVIYISKGKAFAIGVTDEPMPIYLELEIKDIIQLITESKEEQWDNVLAPLNTMDSHYPADGVDPVKLAEHPDGLLD